MSDEEGVAPVDTVDRFQLGAALTGRRAPAIAVSMAEVINPDRLDGKTLSSSFQC